MSAKFIFLVAFSNVRCQPSLTEARIHLTREVREEGIACLPFSVIGQSRFLIFTCELIHCPITTIKNRRKINVANTFIFPHRRTWRFTYSTTEKTENNVASKE